MADHAAAAEKCLERVGEEGDTQFGLALLAEAAVHALLAINGQLAAINAAIAEARDA